MKKVLGSGVQGSRFQAPSPKPEAIPLGTPPFLKGVGGIFVLLQSAFNEISYYKLGVNFFARPAA